MSVVAHRSLPADVQARLLDIVAAGHQPGFFVRRLGRGRLALALLIAGAVAFASISFTAAIAAALAQNRDPAGATVLTAVIVLVVLPSSIYALVCLVELMRSMGSRLQPFVLVTPVELIRGDFDHGTIEFYRLADATQFHVIKHNRKELRYEFQFANDPSPPLFNPTIKIRDGHGVDIIDGALGYAREIKDDPQAKADARAYYQLIPDDAPAVRRHRPLAQPFSNFWTMGGLLYAVAACILFALAVILGGLGRRR